MLECTLKRTHTFWLSLFFVGIVAGGMMLPAAFALADSWAGTPDGKATPTTQAAQGTDTSTSPAANKWNALKNAPTSASDSCWSSPLTCLGVKFLNGLTEAMAWLGSGAATLFVWMVQPANISGETGLLNKASVYELWKFIRDFFNIFFILILLLSAFATVFQVENFSIRKIFLNVLLAAMIINFSFPITRFLIDVANVPMYYFLNAVIPGKDGGLAFAQGYLSSTGMAGLSVSPGTDFVKAFINLVFMFLFSISLLVLAVLFLIRLIVLTLLLVLSPIGFAATLLPGMHGVGSRWWEEFWRYAFFGPSAALMLLVAVRFQSELAGDGTTASFNKVSTVMSAGSQAGSTMTLIAFYCIPLVLIWIAIGMANKSSIAGASLVTGYGYAAARKVGKFGKRLTVGSAKAVLPTNVAKGMAAGAKEGLKSGKLFGTQVIHKALTQKAFKERAEEREAKWKGRVKEGTGANEIQKLQSKRQYEAAEEMKKNNVSDTDLRNALSGGDKTKAAAAAMVLTDRKAIKTAADFEKALDVLGDNTKEIAELIEKAGDGVMDTLNVSQYKKVVAVESKAVAAGYNPEIQKQLNARLSKGGDSKLLVDYELDIATGGSPTAATVAQVEAAVRKVLAPMKSSRDVAKQESLFDDPTYSGFAQFVISGRTIDQIQQIKKASAEEGTSVGSYFP